MAKHTMKKMGRTLEDVPLRKLVKSIRQDIEKQFLSRVQPPEASLRARKPKRKQG